MLKGVGVNMGDDEVSAEVQSRGSSLEGWQVSQATHPYSKAETGRHSFYGLCGNSLETNDAICSCRDELADI